MWLSSATHSKSALRKQWRGEVRLKCACVAGKWFVGVGGDIEGDGFFVNLFCRRYKNWKLYLLLTSYQYQSTFLINKRISYNRGIFSFLHWRWRHKRQISVNVVIMKHKIYKKLIILSFRISSWRKTCCLPSFAGELIPSFPQEMSLYILLENLLWWKFSPFPNDFMITQHVVLENLFFFFFWTDVTFFLENKFGWRWVIERGQQGRTGNISKVNLR